MFSKISVTIPRQRFVFLKQNKSIEELKCSVLFELVFFCPTVLAREVRSHLFFFLNYRSFIKFYTFFLLVLSVDFEPVTCDLFPPLDGKQNFCHQKVTKSSTRTKKNTNPKSENQNIEKLKN